MNNLKGAFYLESQRMADFETQLAFGCDPEVLKLFSDSMILKGPHPELTIAVIELPEQTWRETELVWRRSESRFCSSLPRLH